MINKQERNFHYSHIMHKEGPSVGPFCWQPRPKTCQECGAEFTATSPLQKRCKPCQAKVSKARQERYSRTVRAKRKAERKARMQ